MEPLGLRIFSTVIESAMVGAALGGVLIVVRKIQLALGMRDDGKETKPQSSRAH